MAKGGADDPGWRVALLGRNRDPGPEAICDVLSVRHLSVLCTLKSCATRVQTKYFLAYPGSIGR